MGSRERGGKWGPGKEEKNGVQGKRRKTGSRERGGKSDPGKEEENRVQGKRRKMGPGEGGGENQEEMYAYGKTCTTAGHSQN